MKPTAYLSKNPAYLYFKDPSLVSNAMLEEDITRLYTAHEIAEFVRGLYFDDDFKVGSPPFMAIADKIEKESHNNVNKS